MSACRNAPVPIVALARQAALEQLGHALRTGERPDQVEVERLARDRRGFGRRAPLLGQLRGADEDGVAHRVRDRDLAAAIELEALRALLQRAADPHRGRQLLDEERGPLRGLVDRADQRRRGRPVQHHGEQLGHVGASQRPERELVELAGAPQLVAQPPDAVVARQSVGAVDGEHQHRQLGDRLGQRREQLEGRLVGPVQVVEHEHDRLFAREVRQRAADRLHQRRLVGLGGGRSELGQDHRQVRQQRPGPVERARVGAQPRAQRRDDGAVGSGADRAGDAAEDERVGSRRASSAIRRVLPTPASPLTEQDAAGSLARALQWRR